jgi:hypothetical protein
VGTVKGVEFVIPSFKGFNQHKKMGLTFFCIGKNMMITRQMVIHNVLNIQGNGNEWRPNKGLSDIVY